MRSFLIFLLVAGLGVVYLRQKHNETPPAAAKAPSSVAMTPAPQLTPVPRGQASEYNWMKRSLDRAADVRDNAREQTKQNQDP